MKAGDRVVLCWLPPGSLSGMRGTVLGRMRTDGRGRIYKILCVDGIVRNVSRQHMRRTRPRRSRRVPG